MELADYARANGQTGGPAGQARRGNPGMSAPSWVYLAILIALIGYGCAVGIRGLT